MMNRFLLALILIFSVSGAMAQTLGNPTFNSLTLINPLSGAGVAFTPPGRPPETLQARGLFQSFVGDFGASGSNETTAGAITSGSASLSLLSAQDFANGQGVLIPGAGANFAAAQPSATAMVAGTPGSTTVYYDVASLEGAGGVGVPVQTSVTTGPATLTAQNYNWLAITPGSGTTAYAVWKGSSATGPWTYIGSGQNAIYNDTGFVNPYRPWWIPANPPASAQNDWLVAKISNGGGTTSLSLSAPASNTVSSATVRHDDTAAINAALAQSAGVRLEMPCGVYRTSSALNFTVSNVQLWGAGVCSEIMPAGTSDDFDLIGTSTAELNGDTIENLYIVDTGSKAAGFGIYGIYVTKLDISNVIVDHPYSGMELIDFSDVRMAHNRVFRFFSQQGSLLALRSDATNISCCFDGSDFYGYSNATLGDQGTGAIGYWIDGDVATVVMRNFDLSDIPGEGMLVANMIGNAHNPQFIQFTDFGAEYVTGRLVDLEAGQEIGFGGTSLLHAAGDGNFVSCSSSADFYVASGVTTWGWIGGRIDNASGDNVYINSTEGTFRAQSVIEGSAADIGGTLGQCPGVEFGGSAAYVTMTGVQVGNATASSWQAEPILADSGANNIVAVGNTFAGNVLDTIADNSGEINNVFAPNSGDTVPGWAFDHIHAFFGIGNATYMNSGSTPGLGIRGSNAGGDYRITLFNTAGGDSSSEFSTSVIAADAYALWGMHNNSGTNPNFLFQDGAGVTGGATFDASLGGANAPLTLIGGSNIGVVAGPILQLSGTYSVAGTPLPTCSGALTGTLAYVIDATSPTYGGAYVGGGASKTIVLCINPTWTTH
jgi:hypothetical protein